MKPVYLYIENFLCYEKTEIEMSAITSGLIIGKKDGNDDISNGVGKSTIFRAIEYVLFNEARDLNLEEVIRDDTNSCKVIFDFALGKEIWRISRSRTRKGVSDLSLYVRTAHEEAGVNAHTMEATDPKFKLFWEEKSSRRAADTELDLEKLIKTNYKAFSSAFLFAQNDFNSGLANITASKRRAFFKESLPIGVYAKLEKLAKDEGSALVKEMDKKKAIRDNITDLDALAVKLNLDLEVAKELVQPKQSEIEKQEVDVVTLKNNVHSLNDQFTTLRNQISSVLDKRKTAEDRVKRLEISMQDTLTKRKNVADQAKVLVEEIKVVKESEAVLASNVAALATPEQINERITVHRDELATLNATSKRLYAEIQELEIPLPNDAVCKHCRQPLTDEHRRTCVSEIAKDIETKRLQRLLIDTDVNKVSDILRKLDVTLKEVERKRKELDALRASFSFKEKEIVAKKALFQDYNKILEQQKQESAVATEEFESAKKEAENANEQKLTELKSTLDVGQMALRNSERILTTLSQELVKINGNISIIEHNIKLNADAKLQKSELLKQISELEEEYAIYPDLIQACGSTGIPGLIIQGLLDSLQIEANNILSQIKPSLQLAFSVTKTNGKGEEGDDLDIKYFYNNKPRSFGAISGAMKLSVMFALKLGYAFLLHKELGTDIKFLMLDEVDMPLDPASIDALAEIIKHFQKSFTILIISHNDRSKAKLEKFSNIILVEQDQNMVSRAKLV